MLRRYTLAHFDKHGYLKAPKGFYLLLLVLLRAYLIWILSVANRSDTTALITLFYPEKHNFFIALGTGAGALLIAVMYSLRREKTPNWLQPVWNRSLPLLWLSLLADAALTLWMIKSINFHFQPQLAAVALALFVGGIYLATSQHVKDLFEHWPDPHEDEPVKAQDDGETEEKA